jgi:hypothetical protein
LGFGKTEIFLRKGLDSEMADLMTDLPVGPFLMASIVFRED